MPSSMIIRANDTSPKTRAAWIGNKFAAVRNARRDLPVPRGLPGSVLNYADFYALIPPDNAATVAPGTDVSFPQDGPNRGSGIARSGPDSFNPAQIGVYPVLFQVSVTKAGQLILTLNSEDLAYTIAGRATGVSQIVELAITPLAGGTRPVSAHLVITQIQ